MIGQKHLSSVSGVQSDLNLSGKLTAGNTPKQNYVGLPKVAKVRTEQLFDDTMSQYAFVTINISLCKCPFAKVIQGNP